MVFVDLTFEGGHYCRHQPTKPSFLPSIQEQRERSVDGPWFVLFRAFRWDFGCLRNLFLACYSLEIFSLLNDCMIAVLSDKDKSGRIKKRDHDGKRREEMDA